MKFTQILGFYCLCACTANPGWAADGKVLPAKHAKGGVTCFDCHQAEKPAGAAPAGTCMDCHGDAPAMAELTRQLPVNPHMPPRAPHPGPFACTDCHHQHQAPVVKCLECHPKFKFNVK
jgi:hypothetical protein